MEIHKPKPWHGVREFLKEYVIIVVGVLTALGAEQGVEWLHVHAEVGEARAAIHEEMRGNLRALALEARENGCYRTRMAAFAAWAGGTGPKPALRLGALMNGLSSNAWETAKTGAVPRMELKERLALSEFYVGVENQMSLIHSVREKSNAVAGYLYRDSLDPQEAHALIRLAGEERAYLAAESRNVPSLLAWAHKLGVDPGPPNADYEAHVDALCAAHPAEPATEGR